MSGIIDEIKQSFRRGDALIKLIYVNVFVFLVVKLIEVSSFVSQASFGGTIPQLFMCPAWVPDILSQPWGLFTYMFLHQGFLHVLFNLLWLYWIGYIFIDFLNGKRLVAVYIFGGLSGAGLYILAYNMFPVFMPENSYMLGASASVMAIVLAITVYVPNYTLYLVFIGPVKLKWVALVSVVLDVITLADGNPGGHIAHLGGAVFGLYWGFKLKNGTDITKWSYRVSDGIAGLFKPKSKVKMYYNSGSAYKAGKATPHANDNLSKSELDAILDKISKSGYESLSAAEKEKLFQASKMK